MVYFSSLNNIVHIVCMVGRYLLPYTSHVVIPAVSGCLWLEEYYSHDHLWLEGLCFVVTFDVFIPAEGQNFIACPSVSS